MQIYAVCRKTQNVLSEFCRKQQNVSIYLQDLALCGLGDGVDSEWVVGEMRRTGVAVSGCLDGFRALLSFGEMCQISVIQGDVLNR